MPQHLFRTLAMRLPLWVIPVLLLGFIGTRIWFADTIPVTDTTEARYGEMARKMAETNDWITPQFDYNVPFWGKPPLAFWLSAAGIDLFGANEMAARVPIILVGLSLALFLYLWSRSFLKRDMALIASLMLISSAAYYISLGAIMTDLVLTATVSVGLIAFWQRHHGGNWRWEVALYLASGLGLLAKGPIALIFIGFPILVWAAMFAQFKSIWARFAPLKGLLLMLLIALPWYIAAEIKTPGFLRYFLIGEHIMRFLVSGWHGDLYGHAHAEPLGMVWLYWLGSLLPWSLVLIPLLITRRKLIRKNYNQHQRLMIFLALWTLTPLLLFTLAHNIIWTYPLPGLPAAIFLLVYLLAKQTSTDRVLYHVTVSAASIMLAFFVAISFRIDTPSINSSKHSQRAVIAYLNQRCPEKTCGIFYWKRRIYSAEFYSQGKARHVSSLADLAADTSKKQFLIVNSADLAHLPLLLRQRYKEIQQMSGETIFVRRAHYPPVNQAPLAGPLPTSHEHLQQVFLALPR